jgi:DNA-binding CsgD family transcriptional regulator
VEEPGSGPWFVRTALLAGHRPRAEAVAAALASLASINGGLRCVNAAVAHARGLLDDDPHRCEEAAGEHVHPWTRAAATEDAGMIESRRGTSRASSLLETATARYDAIGARYDGARARAPLRSLPGRGHRPILTGWHSLTDGERRVALTVAEGLTNAEAGARLFLSRHTVDFHLRHIYRKLEVRSRVQLTRLVLAQDQ